MIKLDNIQGTSEHRQGSIPCVLTNEATITTMVAFLRRDGVRQARGRTWRESSSFIGEMIQGMSSEGSERTDTVTLTVGKLEAEDGSPLQ